MKKSFCFARVSASAVLLVLVTSLGMFTASAQQEGGSTGQGVTTSSVAAGAEQPQEKVRAKPRGRLPNYYGRVVNQEQRLKIYDLQGKFNKEIETLQAQIAAKIKERDAAVESVLTEEQLAQVRKLVEQAEQKRKERRSKKSGDDSGR